jgi:nitrous oxidase accessory protein NosD
MECGASALSLDARVSPQVLQPHRPQPSTLNPQPSTLKLESSTLSGEAPPLTRTHAQIRFNDVIKSKGAGMLIVEEANPLIEGCRIVRGQGNGIEVATKGLGVIKNNDIALNRRSGVDIRTGGDPVVERNRLVKNLVGVVCAEEAKGKVLDNTISESLRAGISVMTASVLEADGNTISGQVHAV